MEELGSLATLTETLQSNFLSYFKATFLSSWFSSARAVLSKHVSISKSSHFIIPIILTDFVIGFIVDLQHSHLCILQYESYYNYGFSVLNG